MPSAHPYRCIACGAYYPMHADVCIGCLRVGTLALWPSRTTADIDAAPEVSSAAALARAAWDETAVAAYRGLRVGSGALVLVSGPPGAGKSTWAVRAIDSVSAPVTYWSAEMGVGPACAALLGRLGVRRESLHVVGRAALDDVHALLARTRSVALAVDSVQVAEVTPEQLRHLLAVLPQLRVVIACAQRNKAGQIAGEMRWPHEADVVVEIDQLRWWLDKSRYQPIEDVGGDVLAAREAAEEVCDDPVA